MSRFHRLASPTRLVSAALAAVLAFAAGPAVAGPKDVTCGDDFKGKGDLTGDCMGSITIQKGRLRMHGHTITGTGVNAITCVETCKILGPGRIIGGGSDRGVFGGGRVTLIDVEVSGHTSLGVRSDFNGGMKLKRCIVNDNGGTGVQSSRVKAIQTEIKNNGLHGILTNFRGVKCKLCQIWNNGGSGIVTSTATSEKSRAKIVTSSILDNGEFGILAKAVITRNANVTGNAMNPDCGVEMPCTDVASVAEPRIRGHNSQCDTSLVVPEDLVGPIPFGPSWGVCELD